MSYTLENKTMKKKIGKSLNVVLIVSVLAILSIAGVVGAVGYDKIFNITNYYEASTDGNLGGQIHNTLESFDAGIAVNGTEIIDSDGIYVGTVEGTIATSATAIVGALTDYGALTAEAITGSSTLSITGLATLTGGLTAVAESHLASTTISAGSYYSIDGTIGVTKTCSTTAAFVVKNGIITSCTTD